jgi:hypothetical protein
VPLIDEREADVNNGRFAQYLDNKGRRRAGAALAAGASSARLSALDDLFYAAAA